MANRRIRKSWAGTWSTRSRFSKPVNMPDVGAMVKAEMYELEMSIPGLAKRMNISADRAYRLLRRNDWRVSEIMTVSALIDYNIFGWYADKTQPVEPVPVAEKPPVSADAELNILRQKNAVLEAENKLLREMVEVLKAKPAG